MKMLVTTIMNESLHEWDEDVGNSNQEGISQWEIDLLGVSVPLLSIHPSLRFKNSGPLQLTQVLCNIKTNIKISVNCFNHIYYTIWRSRFLQLTQVLCNIQVFTKVMPSLFAPNFEDLFINTSYAYQVKSLKLEIPSFIATDESISVIFQELQ